MFECLYVRNKVSSDKNTFFSYTHDMMSKVSEKNFLDKWFGFESKTRKHSRICQKNTKNRKCWGKRSLLSTERSQLFNFLGWFWFFDSRFNFAWFFFFCFTLFQVDSDSATRSSKFLHSDSLILTKSLTDFEILISSWFLSDSQLSQISKNSVFWILDFTFDFPCDSWF